MGANADLGALVPAHRQDDVRAALRTTFGSAPIETAEPLRGGNSGAVILKLTMRGRAAVLRVEPERVTLQHRKRHLRTMASAAEAGAAPAILLADANTGVSIMDYVAARPLAEHPGGAAGLARAAGALLARVRGSAPFPDFGAYPDLIRTMLAALSATGRFPAQDLAPCEEGLARIAGAIPWDLPRVPSHNDVSPRNLIFDGARLWLIDWELAWLNDPLADLAITSIELASGEALERELLAASLGRAPGAPLLARLAVTRLLARLTYGAIVFDSLPFEPDHLGDALTPQGFRRAVDDGQLSPGAHLAAAYARMSLAEFVRGVSAPGFDATLALAADAKL